MNSNYFYKNQEKYKYIECIPLLNDDENRIEFQEEVISSFISICQNQKCQISPSSVISLQYLSNKFECIELTKILNNILSEHSKDLVFDSIIFKKMIEKNTKKIQDTKKEEEIISQNIESYIHDDKFLSLSISLLERIIRQSKDKINEKNFIDFLFKILHKHGKEFSEFIYFIDVHH